MQFLGTCASDGMPNPFCSCKICEDARKNPARQRFCCTFLLDKKNLIDCGPDLNAACMKFGVNLSDLENVYITHTHSDHLCVSMLGLLRMSVTRTSKPIDVFLSEGALEKALNLCRAMAWEVNQVGTMWEIGSGLIRVHTIKIGEPFEQDGYRIMAVETTHRVSDLENAVNYLFEKDGCKLLYACDTGYYPPQTIETLRGARADILVLESTWGSRTDKDTSSHLNCEAFLNMLDILLEAKVIRPDTKIYASHINHKHDLNHDQLQQWFDEHGKLPVTVAFDGLHIDC